MAAPAPAPNAKAPSTAPRSTATYCPSPSVGPMKVNPNGVKFILVTGGVCSSLGKGVTTSSIGALLKSYGYVVSSIKIDPYINPDAGLMSPFEHGEVFVLNDGGEVDLDLGNYERWMSLSLTHRHNITTGNVYKTLLERERRGDYLGVTVQVVPHFIEEVIGRISEVASLPVDGSGMVPHVCMIELGGTIGDLESTPFIEALRQMRFRMPTTDMALCHCTYLPVMGGSQKTKPTQHSCRALLSHGLMPDFLVCRSSKALSAEARVKLGNLVGVAEDHIIGAHDSPNLFDVPVNFDAQDVIDKLRKQLQLPPSNLPPPLGFPTVDDYKQYSAFLSKGKDEVQVIRIAFVGKYVSGGDDAYFSVLQSFEHACLFVRVRIEFHWIDAAHSSMTEEKLYEALNKVDGVFVAGGFGVKGFEMKVMASKWAREHKKPYLGVCLGMQVAVCDVARHVLGVAGATSEEQDRKNAGADHHAIVYMPDISRKTMGGNMRLGAHRVHITDPSSKLAKMYGGATLINERHRHRFEVNMKLYDRFRADGTMSFVGSDTHEFNAETRVEAVEIKDHPFFVAVQYHPEYRTSPADPPPTYAAFIAAAARKEVAFHEGNSRQHAVTGVKPARMSGEAFPAAPK